jgi:hypothetical protein
MKIDQSQDSEFSQPSWAKWREILVRVNDNTRELVVVAGRGSGKTRVASRIVVDAATKPWPHALGEVIYCAAIAPSREQAGILMSYVKASIDPTLIVRETRETLELDLGNGDRNTITIVTASTAAPRGRSYAVVVCDELAFWSTEDSANPDEDILTAIRPGLARVRGSLLVMISSPWGKKGALWKYAQRYAETGGDETHVFAQYDTKTLNPTFDGNAIQQAYDDDPTAAATEYGALWRSDAETFLSRDLIDAAVEHRGDIPWRDGPRYFAHIDPSGGSQDSFALAIAHAEGPAVIIDCAREVKPPFSPDAVAEDFSKAIESYGLSRVTSDRYAGDWPRERFRTHGVHVIPAEKSASQYYAAALPLFSAGRIRIPNHQRLVNQLTNLERTVGRSGRETIGHPPSGHDDIANAVCAAAVEACARASGPPLVAHVVWGQASDRPMPDGFDAKGREWRNGFPWTGTFPEFTHFNMKGIPTDWPPKFEEGHPVGLSDSEKDYFRANPPRPPKKRLIVWG